MTNEIEVRYLKDKEGNTFIPIAHADYVIGIPEDLNDKISKLESDNYYLSTKISELEETINEIKKENKNVLS